MLQVIFVFVFVLRWVVGGGGCWEVGAGHEAISKQNIAA